MPAFAYVLFLAAAASLLGLALYARRGRRAAVDPAIRETKANKEVDLERYAPTGHPALFLERGISAHPFGIGNGGVFCGDCFINTHLKAQASDMIIHSHPCTATGKAWKIVICRDASGADYFVSLERAFLKKK